MILSVIGVIALAVCGFASPATYCVIDLSGGANAASYPVTYLDSAPADGWSDEYKTTNLVLRYIAPGSFNMGGTRPVRFTRAYYIGVFEVTQKSHFRRPTPTVLTRADIFSFLRIMTATTRRCTGRTSRSTTASSTLDGGGASSIA